MAPSPIPIIQHNLLQQALETFRQSFHYRVPLELQHFTQFLDAAKILEVAKEERKQVLKEFTHKLIDIDADISVNFKELEKGIQEVIDECLAKHLDYKTEAEVFLKKEADDLYDLLKSSLEVKLLRNPGMELDLIIRIDKRTAVGFFEQLWRQGNVGLFDEKKRYLEERLQNLEEELKEKQVREIGRKLKYLDTTEMEIKEPVFELKGGDVNMDPSSHDYYNYSSSASTVVSPTSSSPRQISVKQRVFVDSSDQASTSTAIASSSSSLPQPQPLSAKGIQTSDIDTVELNRQDHEQNQVTLMSVSIEAPPENFRKLSEDVKRGDGKVIKLKQAVVRLHRVIIVVTPFPVDIKEEVLSDDNDDDDNNSDFSGCSMSAIASSSLRNSPTKSIDINENTVAEKAQTQTDAGNEVVENELGSKEMDVKGNDSSNVEMSSLEQKASENKENELQRDYANDLDLSSEVKKKRKRSLSDKYVVQKAKRAKCNEAVTVKPGKRMTQAKENVSPSFSDSVSASVRPNETVTPATEISRSNEKGVSVVIPIPASSESVPEAMTTGTSILGCGTVLVSSSHIHAPTVMERSKDMDTDETCAKTELSERPLSYSMNEPPGPSSAVMITPVANLRSKKKSPLIFTLTQDLIKLSLSSSSSMEESPVIGIDQNGKLVCGSEALHCQERWSLMQILEESVGEKTVSFKIGNEEGTQVVCLELLLGFILKKLKDKTSPKTNTAVILVPSWLSSLHRLQIKDAAYIAGFVEVHLFNAESIAAYAHATATTTTTTSKPLRDIDILVLAENFGVITGVMYSYYSDSNRLIMIGDEHLAIPNTLDCSEKARKITQLLRSLHSSTSSARRVDEPLSILILSSSTSSSEESDSEEWLNVLKDMSAKLGFETCSDWIGSGAWIFFEKKVEDVYGSLVEYHPDILTLYRDGVDVNMQYAKLNENEEIRAKVKLPKKIQCPLPMTLLSAVDRPNIYQENILSGKKVILGEMELKMKMDDFITMEVALEITKENIVFQERTLVQVKPNDEGEEVVLSTDHVLWTSPTVMNEEEREKIKKVVLCCLARKRSSEKNT